MKKTFIASVYIVLSILVLYSTSNAQSIDQLAVANHAVAFMGSASEVSFEATESPASFISSKVTGSFNKTFKGAAPKWYKLDNQYLARFTQDGKITHALYKANGYMVYSVTKGSESLLPADVRRVIKSNFTEYEITAATKVTSLGITAWIAD